MLGKPRPHLYGSLAIIALAVCGSVYVARRRRALVEEALSEPPRTVPYGVGTAPKNAKVLLGPGSGWAAWTGATSLDGDVKWSLDHATGVAQIVPATGSIRTLEEFGDVRIHYDWQVPKDGTCGGPPGCNSGIYVMGRYEVQLLLTTDPREPKMGGLHPDHPELSCGSFYGTHAPINLEPDPSKPPKYADPVRPKGEWNDVDIYFRAPRLDSKGHMTEVPRGTVLINGVIVQYDAILTEPTALPWLEGNATKGPIFIEDNNDKINFANIWARDVPAIVSDMVVALAGEPDVYP